MGDIQDDIDDACRDVWATAEEHIMELEARIRALEARFDHLDGLLPQAAI